MEYLTIAAAAALKGRSHDSVSRWIHAGLLKARFGPKGIMVSREELEAMPLPRLGRPRHSPTSRIGWTI